METANDFMTWESLLTFGGATTATVVVPNTAQRALNRNPTWLALLVAVVICLAVVVQAHQSAAGVTTSWTDYLVAVATPWTDYFVALLNGCLVFCAATGAVAVGDSTLSGEGKLVAKSAAGSGPAPKRGFWTRWF